MRVIHLCRKPLSESSVAANVLKHGVGALHIDATRIAAQDVADVKPFGSMPQGNNPEGEAGFRRPWMKDRQSVMDKQLRAIERLKRLGRWPANVVLEHLPECHLVGTVKAPGTSIHGTSTATRRSGVHTDAKGHQTVGRVQPVRGYADEDGMETVAAWDCAPGCPVADLDRQAGPLQSGTGAVKRKTAAEHEGNTGVAFGAESRPAGTAMVSYGDAGGASRFFKQVGGKCGS